MRILLLSVILLSGCVQAEKRSPVGKWTIDGEQIEINEDGRIYSLVDGQPYFLANWSTLWADDSDDLRITFGLHHPVFRSVNPDKYMTIRLKWRIENGQLIWKRT